MKRMGVFLLLFGLLLCGCQNNDPEYADVDNQLLPPPETAETTLSFKEDDVEPAKTALQAFFEAYAVADYESMKPYATESAISAYFHDGDVYGNATAELTRSDFVRQESATQIVFFINAAIEPVPASSQYGMDETGFYVRLVKQEENWLVSEFFTGF